MAKIWIAIQSHTTRIRKGREETIVPVVTVSAIIIQSTGSSQLLNSVLVPLVQIVVGIVVTAVGGIYVYKYRVGRKREKEETNRIDKLETAVFGVDDVETMEGVVEVMDSNYKQTEENAQRIDEVERKVEELEEKQERMATRVELLRDLAREREENRERKWEIEPDQEDDQ